MWTSITTHDETVFIVRPNASLDKHQALIIFGLFGFIFLIISLRFLLLGAWLIIPFVVLDLLFIGWVLAYILKHNRKYETVSCSPDTIHVTRFTGKAKLEWDFQTYWAQVKLSPSRHPWYPSKLFIRSHGNYFEFGSYLTDYERVQLADAINDEINTLKSNKA